MHSLLLTSLAMVAFAANSVLNRAALSGGTIDAASFAAVRLVAGASMLALLCLVMRGGVAFRGPDRVSGAVSLICYLYGFSAAYGALDAGVGALILFGLVQMTMFAAGILARERMPPRRVLGAVLAFAGLCWILWPGAGTTVSLPHGLLMAGAGVAWGIYSLLGRRAEDALAATSANFLVAVPIGLVLTLTLSAGQAPLFVTPEGLALATVSGALTSGLGYALWYHVLPSLAASVAAVAQLSVPVIAVAGGVLFLGEALTGQFALASALVLGGVAVSVARRPGSR